MRIIYTPSIGLVRRKKVGNKTKRMDMVGLRGKCYGEGGSNGIKLGRVAESLKIGVICICKLRKKEWMMAEGQQGRLYVCMYVCMYVKHINACMHVSVYISTYL